MAEIETWTQSAEYITCTVCDVQDAGRLLSGYKYSGSRYVRIIVSLGVDVGLDGSQGRSNSATIYKSQLKKISIYLSYLIVFGSRLVGSNIWLRVLRDQTRQDTRFKLSIMSNKTRKRLLKN